MQINDVETLHNEKKTSTLFACKRPEMTTKCTEKISLLFNIYWTFNIYTKNYVLSTKKESDRESSLQNKLIESSAKTQFVDIMKK